MFSFLYFCIDSSVSEQHTYHSVYDVRLQVVSPIDGNIEFYWNNTYLDTRAATQGEVVSLYLPDYIDLDWLEHNTTYSWYTIPPINVTHNVIFVYPPSIDVSEGQNVNFNVTCIPYTPIKSFECKVLFNASLMQAVAVAEGDFFEGYQTFYNAGIINNSGGNIINIYDLIVGPGNITERGNFVTISFIGLKNGKASIQLYDTGITNETQYIPFVNLSSANTFSTSPAWDVNEDGLINYVDVSKLVSDYGKSCVPGSIGSDVDNNGVVNHLDISSLMSHLYQ